MQNVRSPLRVTFAVWKAIFLREALERLFDMRAAWLWLFVEPILHIAFLVFIRTVIRTRHIAGADVVIWIVVGLLGFFYFRRTAMQVMHAIDSNYALFAYRQVQPFDAALMRGVLEAFLMTIISALILFGVHQFDHVILPDNIFMVFFAVLGLWLFGLGFGMVGSVAIRMVPEAKHVLHILMLPLYIISGVIWPLQAIPQPYLDWLMINPIAHGLELIRHGFEHSYQMVGSTSMGYMYQWAVCSILLGLMLYRRFDAELVMK